MESSTLKSILYRNRESKHYEYNRKNQESRIRNAFNATTSGPKKAWKKIKLALFGHIEELKVAVSYPQSVVNNLIDLQVL